MTEFKRKKGESFESFLRRFNKRLQQSKKLLQARKNQYLQPKINKNKQKLRALVGRKISEEREYLRKIGKLKEEPKKRW